MRTHRDGASPWVSTPRRLSGDYSRRCGILPRHTDAPGRCVSLGINSQTTERRLLKEMRRPAASCGRTGTVCLLGNRLPGDRATAAQGDAASRRVMWTHRDGASPWESTPRRPSDGCSRRCGVPPRLLINRRVCSNHVSSQVYTPCSPLQLQQQLDNQEVRTQLLQCLHRLS